MHDEGQNSQNWGFKIPNEQREFHFHDTNSVSNSFCILFSTHNVLDLVILHEQKQCNDMYDSCNYATTSYNYGRGL